MPKNGASDEREVIYIPDDEGNDEAFEVVMTFERDDNGSKYMMVTPADGEVDEDGHTEVYAFRYTDDDDHLHLYLIEDEDEWAVVEETFNTLLGDQEEDDGEQDATL
ncbi:DUF1292 domain-containing protein [Numidum massiliense]|uniref:DUF1292 domain-containing protein n=1 Tax=Numidum massiliense TaxID=1522315 RepID=UPI0006D54D1D|nr:DUF1292 domain-containing protein [Numidum massiliense]